jgi:DNA-binding HxlR family transcriptional regulator
MEVTKAEYKVIANELKIRANTGREYFENRSWLGKYSPKYSYSTLRQLIRKGIIKKIDKKYHTYERHKYRFTDKFMSNPAVTIKTSK